MTSAVPVITLSPRDYDAVLFDLDGVLTRSASVHAAARKKLFDGFLEQRATQAGAPFVPFDTATDYPRYVDGKPRYDGVAAFLASRGIELPLGAAEDGPEVQSVHALGKLKDLEDFDPAEEGIREALCTLGNGYFATRGAAAGAQADDIHYPGTYLAGGYNRLRTDIAGRLVENEDLVNCPNWLALAFRIAGEDWFDARSVKLLAYRQELDLRRGLLLRRISFEDGQGRRSTLREQRLVSMGDMHLGALELALSADNWSAVVTVRSAIDARVANDGAKLYRKFNNKHLEPLSGELVGEDGVCLLARTCQSHISVAQAARTPSFLDGKLVETRRRVVEEPGYIGQELKVELTQGETLVLEKLASLYTSRDHAISECALAARKAIVRAGRFDAVLAEHVLAWKHLWRRFDAHIQPAEQGFKSNVPMLLRLNMFHLLQAVSPNSIYICHST